MSKRFVRALSRTVDNIVLLTLLVILAVAIYALYDTTRLNEEADAAKYISYKPTTEEGKKSFEELRAMNPDVMGWLTVYGTSIDYPIVKAQNNNFEYLSKDVEKNWTTSGSLYVDVHNQWNFQDFNTIIHGHHMADHKMFGDLDLFTKASYFNEHQYANLFYEGKNHGVEFFAILTIDAYNPIVHSTNLTTDEAKKQFLDRIKQDQLLSRNVEINKDDHLVTMTTCNLDETNGRFTLVGKILDHEVPNPFPDEVVTKVERRVDLYNVFNTIIKLPVWQWILILIALIILIWVLYRFERRRLVNREKKKEMKRD